MKRIKKVSTAKVDPITGSVSDTYNITDKTKNAPSIRLTEEMIDKKNNYSTEEIVIGTWIDGKPLYRK